jgi:aminopeptidase N
LHHYLLKHAYANARTEDLWAALEEVSGKPVGKIMSNWTVKAGHPIISVKHKAKSGKVTLTQNRFFSSPIYRRQTKDKTIWSIPLNGWLMGKKTMTVGAFGKLNKGEVSIVRVDYPRPLLKDLEKEVRRKTLSAQDRLGLVRDSFDLAQAGNASTMLALELAESYMHEEDYPVWSELTGKLSKVNSLLANERFYEDFRKFGRILYTDIASKMGWEKRKEEKHTDALLRSLALHELGQYGGVNVIEKCQRMFGQKIDPDLRGLVYNIVAANGGSFEFHTLMRMYKEEEHQQEKDRIGRALGFFKRGAFLEKTLQFAVSKHVRYQNALGIIVAVWKNPKGRYLAWEFVKANWKLLKERYAGGHYFTRVFGPTGDFTKALDAKDIERFVRKNPIPEAQRTIAQAVEQIYANEDWLARDRKRISDFLRTFDVA